MTVTDANANAGSPPRFGPLTIYGYYRVFLAAALLLLFIVNLDRAERLGSYRPDMYLAASVAYLVAAVLSTLLVRLVSSSEQVQGALLIAIDILSLTVLAHASGGVSSTVAPLLVVTVAAGAILLPGRMALLVAAAATLAILYEQLYFALSSGLPLTTGSTQSGLLGVAFFGIAVAANQLTRRLVASEALARSRSKEISELEHLNAHIIQRMRTGILVVDADGVARLANSAAQQMLSPTPWQCPAALASLSEELPLRVRTWLLDSEQRFPAFRNYPEGPEISASMTAIRLAERRATLVFLEDMTTFSHHLQQMKLASLGRLTASIAHEIRNPLSAISHAAQLLDESPALATEDRRLAEIVQQQALRLDRIVENVLQLSRRQVPRSDLLELVSWLRQFRTDYLATHAHGDELEILALAGHARARFDPNHLHQILQNLCDNGLRYGRAATGTGLVTLEVSVATNDLPQLRIFDNGPGVPEDKQASLFEPFFTTEARGTGLGLYIARELCEANRARLVHVPARDGTRSHFQITFAHPGRIAS